MSDNLSLNGAGGITRRMTDKEKIAELEKQLEFKVAVTKGLESRLAESVPKKDSDERYHSMKLQLERQDSEIKGLDAIINQSISKVKVKSLVSNSEQVGTWISNHEAFEYLCEKLKLLTNK